MKTHLKQLIKEEIYKILNEEINLDISVGDILLGGRFKNKKVLIKTIGKDELGQPTINGKPLLKFRIKKLMPDKKNNKSSMKEEHDYRIQHTAPDSGHGAPLYDLTLNGIYPKDFYQTIEHYKDHNPGADEESMAKIRMFKDKPEKSVVVYRAVPQKVKKEHDKNLKNWLRRKYSEDDKRPSSINPGDWVTLSLTYAKQHAEDLEGPGISGKIITQRIPAKYLWTDGNSFNEWGYDPS